MKKEELLEYNLIKISDIDSKIKDNNYKKNHMYEKNIRKLNIYNKLSKLMNKYVQLILVLILSIIIYINVHNGIITTLVSIVITILLNSLLLLLLNILKPKDNYKSKIDKLTYENNELYTKRNTYINLYNYTLNSDKTIMNNIKLRINRKKYYEYDKYIGQYSNNKDSYEFITLNKMKKEENILIESIKNKIFWELNPNFKTEQLSKEQLKLIADSI